MSKDKNPPPSVDAENYCKEHFYIDGEWQEGNGIAHHAFQAGQAAERAKILTLEEKVLDYYEAFLKGVKDLQAERERSKKLVEALEKINSQHAIIQNSGRECGQHLLDIWSISDEALKSYNEGAG